MFCRNLEKRSRKARKSSKFDVRMRAIEDLAMASSHCRDKPKNCRNKEMSKWPEDCRNNRFSVATKNWPNSFVNKRILSRHFIVCCDRILGKDN